MKCIAVALTGLTLALSVPVASAEAPATPNLKEWNIPWDNTRPVTPGWGPARTPSGLWGRPATTWPP